MSVTTTIPQSFRPGDSFSFDVSDPDHPNTDGWDLQVLLMPAAGAAGTVVAIGDLDSPPGAGVTENADGSWTIDVTTGTSAAFVGDSVYRWIFRAKNGSEQTTLDEGNVSTLTAFTAGATGADGRTHARKMLDAVRAAMEVQAGDATVQSLSIRDRSFSAYSWDELLRLEGYWASVVQKELDDARRKAGLATSRRAIGVRFSS